MVQYGARKKLKSGFRARYTHGIAVADPDTLMRLSSNITKEAQGPHTSKYRILGTSTNVLNMNKLGLLPTRNYQEGVFEGAETVSGEYLHEHHAGKDHCLRAVPHCL